VSIGENRHTRRMCRAYVLLGSTPRDPSFSFPFSFSVLAPFTLTFPPFHSISLFRDCPHDHHSLRKTPGFWKVWISQLLGVSVLRFVGEYRNLEVGFIFWEQCYSTMHVKTPHSDLTGRGRLRHEIGTAPSVVCPRLMCESGMKGFGRGEVKITALETLAELIQVANGTSGLPKPVAESLADKIDLQGVEKVPTAYMP
jgi:hypothetical protein